MIHKELKTKMALRPVDLHTKIQLDNYLGEIEKILEADALAILGPILPQLEYKINTAVGLFKSSKTRIAIVLDTLGGIVEVVERVVHVIRQHYKEVDFLIPDRAMSAGTIFVMAGDRIFMDDFSCLGPIDPQIMKDGELVPALSYLNQYLRFYERAERGELNAAEFALLSKLDPGELYQFEQARELSCELLTNWLSTYKFKNWKPQGLPITDPEKRERATKIADILSNNERWHSHGRMISRETLINEINLEIEKLEDTPSLCRALNDYTGLVMDYVNRLAPDTHAPFVHTREFF